MPLSIIILAAGKGTRMKSNRPKVIHPIAGKSMLQHVVDTSRLLEPDQIVIVIGHEADQVRALMQDQNVRFVEQSKQLGTGHAVAQCVDVIRPGNHVLVLAGDVPLIAAETLQTLCAQIGSASVNVLSFTPENSYGYGRIVRSADGMVKAIVEEKSATAEEKMIRECNSGIILIDGDKLAQLITQLDDNNPQAEYLLTDVVKHAVQQHWPVMATQCTQVDEVNGINNQAQLAMVECLYRQQQAGRLMQQGVKLYDPARIDVRGSLQVGMDVEIDINCIFEGEVKLGDGVRIGANCVICNSTIDRHSRILPMTVIDEADIGSQVSIGPFARIRPGTECADQVKIGNFVETKKAQIGVGSKVSHLSYIGDTEIGREVNIGAGTITCNYDGANKFKTVIEDGVFIGSDTQLVAPVTIGRGATIGAGSTITKDVPADKLSLSRVRQITVNAWERPVKNSKE